MRKYSKPANMYIMVGLLAVLFLTLGYLSMQGQREGLTPPSMEALMQMQKKDMEEKKEGFAHASLKNMKK
jgi:hypothetical protein